MDETWGIKNVWIAIVIAIYHQRMNEWWIDYEIGLRFVTAISKSSTHFELDRWNEYLRFGIAKSWARIWRITFLRSTADPYQQKIANMYKTMKNEEGILCRLTRNPTEAKYEGCDPCRSKRARQWMMKKMKTIATPCRNIQELNQPWARPMKWLSTDEHNLVFLLYYKKCKM